MNGTGQGIGDWVVVIRTIHFAASAILAGVLLFRAVVAAPALRMAPPAAQAVAARTLGTAWIGLAITAASGLAWLLLQAPMMSGLAVGEAMTAEVIGTVVTQTQFGLISEIRLALAIVLAICLGCDRYPRLRWLGLVSALGLVAAIAPTGHAGSTEGTAGWLHLAADAIHLVASAAWIGGIVALILLLATTRRHNPVAWPALVRAAAERFSSLAVLSVMALLASGIVNGVILVGSVRALLITEYGQLLLLKIALFAVMLGLAAVNRFRLTPRLGGRPDPGGELDAVRRLGRNCHIELALGLIVFAIVGLLGTLHPAIHLLPP